VIRAFFIAVTMVTASFAIGRADGRPEKTGTIVSPFAADGIPAHVFAVMAKPPPS